MHISTTGCYLLEETLNLKFNSLPKSCFWCSGGASTHTMYFHMFVLIEAVYCFFGFGNWGKDMLFTKLPLCHCLSISLYQCISSIWDDHTWVIPTTITSTLGVNGPEVTYAGGSQKYGGRSIYSVLNFVHSKKLEGWGSFAILYTSTMADC